jgi:signal transduction histidine kinase/DNA-binding response OmpR family regulator/ligand-binding sensor domain-containing protein
MMNKTLYLLVGIVFSLQIDAQPNCIFTHYSSEDGLSQNTVMSILQDHKGNMWFSTWDGLNKFNGYTFRTYKAQFDNNIALSHNRVDYIGEDKYGYLWLQTYDAHAYRFDPRTESFERVPAEGTEGDDEVHVTKIEMLPDGTVWVLGEKTEGIIRVLTDPHTYKLSVSYFPSRTAQFPLLGVRRICQDFAGNEWILSDNGLGMIACGMSHPVAYFVETNGKKKGKQQAFYNYLENGNNIYFGSNNGHIWRYQKYSGQFLLLQMPTVSSIISINKISEKELIVTTATDGFFIYNLKTKKIDHFPASRFPDAAIHSVYVDKYDEIWFEQHVSGTVVHFNPHTRVLKLEQIPVEPTSTDRSRPAFHIHEDINDRLWVHPYGGGFSYFDRKSNCLRPFYDSLQGDDWRFSNKIHSAFSDRQGNLWLCTHSKGLEKITFRPSLFRMETLVPHNYESLSNEVRALYEDSDQNLWVGVKDGKLRVFDKQRKDRGYLTENGIVSHSGSPLRGNVYFVMQDHNKNLWIATKGDGLVKAVRLKEPYHYKLTRYQYHEDDIYSLSSDDVYCIYEDSHDRIWIATFSGGVNYLAHSQGGRDVFINYRNNLKDYPIDCCYKARFITSDHKGHIWIGTTVGALMIDENFKNPEDIKFHHYIRIPDNANSLSNNDVHWITVTKKGELYIATFGGGLDKLLSLDKNGNAKFKSYTVAEGLSSDVILSIREDHKGYLWMSTENGVSQFIPSEEKFENYDDKGISFQVRFSEAASEFTSFGDILFGSNKGIFIFNPDSIKKSNYVPSIVFSKLLIANEAVTPGEGSLLKYALDDTYSLKLSHKENVVTIQFAALDFSAPPEIQYAYILDGFEQNWNYVGKQRIATYTNLPKGHYVFKVRSTNGDGVWTNNTRTLDIEVLPSFWETPLAYFLYVFFVIAIIVIAVYILFTIYRLKHEVSMEQRMTDMKLRFFTDISHELRTPLTLISGPVEYVLEHSSLSKETREQLQIVEKNTSRMLRLINQILDFRKIQNKKMRMQVQRVNVVSFIRQLMKNFDSIAEEHHVDFLFETEKDELFLWVDVDKLEKIMFNLISNAFKYTPNGKMIIIFIREDKDTVSIGVQDQGIGIPENRKKTLFVRFENLMDHTLFNQSSTGIGLSLVKELVEMHKATISVDSKAGEGSCFKVDFLKGKDHYDDTVEVLQDDITAGMEFVSEEVVNSEEEKEDLSSSNEFKMQPVTKNIMLLVEDNHELRLFLRTIFSTEFRIVEAANGMEGWSKALKFLPDIIISDVMMPEKDGISMTRELRADMTTSHIPIVLLTAKTAAESRIEGLEYGADDYITKPFSATYLRVRVKNLLTQRQKLRDLYRHNLTMGDSSSLQEDEDFISDHGPEMSPNDCKFMDKLVELMEKNIDNGDLVVDDLVQELAVSRSVFFKKLKSLTGLSPIEFIKEMRMKRAIELIKKGEFSMAQISYMVGINDPRYFSKCFKQKMGMTPTEYRDSILKK